MKIFLVLVVVLADQPYFSSVYPLALLGDSVLADVSSDAVLFPGLPLSDVLPAVRPNEGSLALALVVKKLSLVLFTVSPSENSQPVLFVFNKTRMRPFLSTYS